MKFSAPWKLFQNWFPFTKEVERLNRMTVRIMILKIEYIRDRWWGLIQSYITLLTTFEVLSKRISNYHISKRTRDWSDYQITTQKNATEIAISFKILSIYCFIVIIS
jgi:hypothetical protein